MSALRLADVHLPLPLSALRRRSSLGSSRFAPQTNFTEIDNDLSDVDLEGRSGLPHLRAVPRGVRRPAHADRSRCSRDRLFTPEALDVHPARSPATSSASNRRARPEPGHGQHRPQPAAGRTPDDDGGIEVQPLLDERIDDRPRPTRSARRVLDDPLLRGDLVSEDGTRHGHRRHLRRGPHRRRARRGHRPDSRARRPRLPGGHARRTTTAASRSARPTTASRSRTPMKLTPPILLLTIGAHLRDVPLVAHHRLLVIGAVARQRGLDDGPVRADGVHVQRARQHAAAAGHGPGDRRRRAHRAALQPRAARDRQQGARVQVERAALFAPLLGASGTTALGLLSLATSNVVAVRAFGIGAAVGVMVDFVMSLVFVPTLLMLLQARDRRRAAGALAGRADAARGALLDAPRAARCSSSRSC